MAIGAQVLRLVEFSSLKFLLSGPALFIVRWYQPLVEVWLSSPASATCYWSCTPHCAVGTGFLLIFLTFPFIGGFVKSQVGCFGLLTLSLVLAHHFKPSEHHFSVFSDQGF